MGKVILELPVLLSTAGLADLLLVPDGTGPNSSSNIASKTGRYGYSVQG
jgi:hypothetical protein